jgi:hypothetical protein
MEMAPRAEAIARPCDADRQSLLLAPTPAVAPLFRRQGSEWKGECSVDRRGRGADRRRPDPSGQRWMQGQRHLRPTILRGAQRAHRTDGCVSPPVPAREFGTPPGCRGPRAEFLARYLPAGSRSWRGLPGSVTSREVLLPPSGPVKGTTRAPPRVHRPIFE